MKRSDLLQIKKFIPDKIWKLIVGSIFIGVLSFFVESSMIIILQGVLVSLGLMAREASSLPDFYPTSVLPAFLAVAGFGFSRSVANFFKTHMAALAQHQFTSFIRSKILKIAVKKGNTVSHDEVIAYFSEVTTQSGNVILYINLLTSSLICTGLLFILGLYVAFWEMVIGVIALGLIAIPYAKYNQKIKKSGAGLVVEWEKINNVILIGLKNNFFLKIFNLENKEIQKGEGILREYENHLKQYSFIASFFFSLPSFLGVLVVCFISIVGKSYLGSDSIKLLSFYYIFIRFSQFASESYASFAFFSLNYEGVKKLSNWLKLHLSDIQEDMRHNGKKIEKCEDVTVSIQNLSFGYSGKLLFQNLNIELKKSDFLLIKGHSGSGKSTLLNLIFGLIKPTSGNVLFNGEHEIKNLADIIGYVGPEPYLIPGTIRENLVYGSNISVTDSEMYGALEKVGLLDLVQSFSEKLDYRLSDHAQISTGQRQRLSMARAIIRHARIFILDEATSNIDHYTEDKIIKILEELKKDMIIVSVSHKDSFDNLATTRLVLGDN
ncbi:MAG: ABC transporter ATP-binding protein/permease [Bacteriovoracaceae bacterium]|nr:ABC transporter ATP-binding protein/permease [Bacteriovoracaceae bacterium]